MSGAYSTVKEVLLLTQGLLDDGYGANDLQPRVPRALAALEELAIAVRYRRAVEAHLADPLVAGWARAHLLECMAAVGLDPPLPAPAPPPPRDPAKPSRW